MVRAVKGRQETETIVLSREDAERKIMGRCP